MKCVDLYEYLLCIQNSIGRRKSIQRRKKEKKGTSPPDLNPTSRAVALCFGSGVVICSLCDSRHHPLHLASLLF